MNLRNFGLLGMVLASTAQAQVPPISEQELLKCFTPEEMRALVDGYSKAIADRVKPYMAEQLKRGQLAVQASKEAETLYTQCMKREGADVAHHLMKEPLPCGAERDVWTAARKRIPNFRSPPEQKAMEEALNPILVEETQRIEDAVRIRCGK